MANVISIQSGYTLPFDGVKRKKKRKGGKRRSSAALKKQQNKMKACALKWRKSGKKGSYRSFMKKCL